MQHQATQPTGLVKYLAPQNLAPQNSAPTNLAQPNLASKSLAPRHEAPLLKRFVGKLVVDVLPATFVSVLGGVIIAQYQLNHAAASHPATEQVVPASAEMMQLVRDEHAVIIDYLKAQMAAEKNRHAAEDAAVADARLDGGRTAGAGRSPAAGSARRRDGGHSQAGVGANQGGDCFGSAAARAALDRAGRSAGGRCARG